MKLDDILNPSTAIGAILIAVISGLILQLFTKNDNKTKTNNIKTRDNSGFIFQDTEIEGDINGKSENKE